MIAADVDKEKVLSAVVSFWRQKKDERITKETEYWKECWLAYNAKFGKTWQNVKKYRSQRYIPVSTQAVDSVTSHIIQGIFPHDNWVKVEGRTPDDVRSAKVMTELMKWQHFKTKWRSGFSRAVKQAVIFGNTPWGVVWKEDLVYVPDPEAYAGQLGAYAVNQTLDDKPPGMPVKRQRNYDGPVFLTHNIFDTVVDRRPDDPDRGIICLKMGKSKAYIKAMGVPDPTTGYAIYENLDGITEGDTENETSDSVAREVDNALGFVNIPKDGVELLVAWGDFEIDGQVYENHVATVANRSTLIRFEPNPYWSGRRPWNMFVMNEDPLEIYGRGILESNLGLADWINVTANQVIEARAHVCNPEWEVVDDGTLDIEQWESFPGAVHTVTAQGNIRQLVKPDQTASSMESIGFAMSQFNEMTGAMRAFTTQDYQKSATEVNVTAGMLNSRFAELIRHFENNLVIPALEAEIQLNQQMMDEAVWIRIVEPGPDLRTGMPYDSTQPAHLRVTPEDIQGEFDLFPVGASWVAQNQQAMGQVMQLTQMLAQSPAQNVIKWNEFAKVMYENSGFTSAHRFVKTDQELAYEQQQAALAAQMQQQMGQSPGPGQSGPPQGNSGGRGSQSMAGVPGAPPGGGAAQGPTEQTPGGPQRTG